MKNGTSFASDNFGFPRSNNSGMQDSLLEEFEPHHHFKKRSYYGEPVFPYAGDSNVIIFTISIFWAMFIILPLLFLIDCLHDIQAKSAVSTVSQVEQESPYDDINKKTNPSEPPSKKNQKKTESCIIQGAPSLQNSSILIPMKSDASMQPSASSSMIMPPSKLKPALAPTRQDLRSKKPVLSAADLENTMSRDSSLTELGSSKQLSSQNIKFIFERDKTISGRKKDAVMSAPAILPSSKEAPSKELMPHSTHTFDIPSIASTAATEVIVVEEEPQVKITETQRSYATGTLRRLEDLYILKFPPYSAQNIGQSDAQPRQDGSKAMHPRSDPSMYQHTQFPFIIPQSIEERLIPICQCRSSENKSLSTKKHQSKEVPHAEDGHTKKDDSGLLRRQQIYSSHSELNAPGPSTEVISQASRITQTKSEDFPERLKTVSRTTQTSPREQSNENLDIKPPCSVHSNYTMSGVLKTEVGTNADLKNYPQDCCGKRKCPKGYRQPREKTWTEFIEYLQADGGWCYPVYEDEESRSTESERNEHQENQDR